MRILDYTRYKSKELGSFSYTLDFISCILTETFASDVHYSPPFAIVYVSQFVVYINACCRKIPESPRLDHRLWILPYISRHIRWFTVIASIGYNIPLIYIKFVDFGISIFKGFDKRAFKEVFYLNFYYRCQILKCQLTKQRDTLNIFNRLTIQATCNLEKPNKFLYRAVYIIHRIF